MSGVQKQLENAAWKPGNIAGDGGWTFTGGTAGEPSTVATYQAPRPVRLREDRELDLAVPTFEQFSTSGAGSQETFNLSFDLLDTPATEGIVVNKADGSGGYTRVYPDSVDYANDSFDYTDGGSTEQLVVTYIPRDPASVEFRKVAPGGGATIEQPLFEIPTAIAHTRDQSQDPLSFDLNRSKFHDTVPRKWKIEVVVDAPYPAAFGDESLGLVAPNGLLSVPVARTEQRIRGLKDAVKADIAGLS
ncbi:hypothetical protein [Haloarchaeobius litoreus]|uniref:Uncharacterized protein n=1 Tax=Haloarchaeobius litoreus TaxID=755306 RepID=A0ABD6DKF9_9EURY|nr:hypothetical protein [Haloarchaeobius litoreus]